ncbi:MAG TPA: methylmalonyl-CoA epimerase [Thermoplasmata archaeon]|nr:methylmalonyl-CoA epimerase [Thermoplasmata archaeon]
MIRTAHHVGIALKRLDEGLAIYRALGFEPESVEEIPSEGVRAAFLPAGPVKIELLESIRPDGVIARFIERHGEGVHHIAFATDDIHATIRGARAQGFELVDENPRRGAHGRLVAFVHPRSAHGVLLEFVQEAPSQASQRD